MFDSHIRPFIDPPLMRLARGLERIGVSPNGMTSMGLICAFMCFFALYFQIYYGALICLLLNRFADGLDGHIARVFNEKEKPHHKDFGAYYDIVSDFIFYGGVPLFFALGEPEFFRPACFLLFSFILSASSFLAYAIIAEKRKLVTQAQGKKGFYYMAGLMEGSETIFFFIAMMAMPAYFPLLAYVFAVLCGFTLVGRLFMAHQNFTAPSS